MPFYPNGNIDCWALTVITETLDVLSSGNDSDIESMDNVLWDCRNEAGIREHIATVLDLENVNGILKDAILNSIDYNQMLTDIKDYCENNDIDLEASYKRSSEPEEFYYDESHNYDAMIEQRCKECCAIKAE